MLYEFLDGCDTEMALRNPADHLDVAQSARAALDIRLEVVGRIVVAVVTLNLFVAFVLEEAVGRPEPVRRHRNLHCVEELERSIEQSGFEQRRRYREVGRGLLDALIHGAYAVPYLEPHVPQRRDEIR